MHAKAQHCLLRLLQAEHVLRAAPALFVSIEAGRRDCGDLLRWFCGSGSSPCHGAHPASRQSFDSRAFVVWLCPSRSSSVFVSAGLWGSFTCLGRANARLFAQPCTFARPPCSVSFMAVRGGAVASSGRHVCCGISLKHPTGKPTRRWTLEWRWKPAHSDRGNAALFASLVSSGACSPRGARLRFD